MCFVINYVNFYLFVEKSLLALMVLMTYFIYFFIYFIYDSDFKLREILIFAKPFSEVSHTAWEVEKAIKTGLASFGIGKYDFSKTLVIDTVRF